MRLDLSDPKWSKVRNGYLIKFEQDDQSLISYTEKCGQNETQKKYSPGEVIIPIKELIQYEYNM